MSYCCLLESSCYHRKYYITLVCTGNNEKIFVFFYLPFLHISFFFIVFTYPSFCDLCTVVYCLSSLLLRHLPHLNCISFSENRYLLDFRTSGRNTKEAYRISYEKKSQNSATTLISTSQSLIQIRCYGYARLLPH